jgi:Dihydrodipicolinate synthetase family
MTDFEVHAALTTPFRTDAWVDRNALRAHIQLFVEDRVQEIVPARTTGEGTPLQESEVGALVATAVQAGRAGRGDRPRRADLHAGDAAAGVGGRRLGGVLAYTFPARSGNELPPEVLETLAADGIARPQGLQRTSSKHAAEVPLGGLVMVPFALPLARRPVSVPGLPAARVVKAAGAR